MADSSLADLGPLVRARGERWRLERLEPGERCTACTLAGLGPTNAARRLTLLAPFDRIEPWARRPRPRVATRLATIRAAAALAAGECAPGIPTAAAAARLALLSWQLAPAVLLSHGLTHRLLLADAVGLGKTIQAGLAIADLCTRHPAGRILVVVPAGLRPEWARELADRFGLDATMADLAWLARRTRALPAGVNPWQLEPLVLTSMDFVKQPEVLAGLADLSWDLLVIDEAHTIGTDSGRARTAAALARRSLRVLLLTATPHDGDASRFAELCGLGRLSRNEPPMTLVRRGRAAIGVPADRRERILRVRSTPDELRVFALLARYTARVMAEARGPHAPGARLGTSVLFKRALSSASAFARTVTRRLALLSGPVEDPPHQPALPFGSDADWSAGPDDDLPDEVLRYRGLASSSVERAWLRLLAETARVASRRGESKVRALGRLLRRAGEPALVFTEYRDTLGILARRLADLGPAALLHGGLGLDERQRALRSFTRGPARLLLATDAASEGLNLHERCRLAITFELPWNPLRLEQRIGRVDRIGQTRRVHAVHLLARGTPEEALLARLEARRARIGQALAPGGTDDGGAGSPGRTSAARWGDRLGGWPPAASGSPGAASGGPTDRTLAGRPEAAQSIPPQAVGAGSPDGAPRPATWCGPDITIDLEAAARTIATIRRARCLLVPAAVRTPAAPTADDSGAGDSTRAALSEQARRPHVAPAAGCDAIDAAIARIDVRLASGHPWVACLRPSARRPWSGMLFLFVAARRDPAGRETSRTTLAIHVPIPVPVLRRRRDVRGWAVPRIARLQPALEPIVARELAARWALEIEADALASPHVELRRALVARAAAEAARRPAAAPSLFGRYATAPAPTPAARPGSPAGSGHRLAFRGRAAAPPREDGRHATLTARPAVPAAPDVDGPWLAVVLLAPGGGRRGPVPSLGPEHAAPPLHGKRRRQVAGDPPGCPNEPGDPPAWPDLDRNGPGRRSPP